MVRASRTRLVPGGQPAAGRVGNRGADLRRGSWGRRLSCVKRGAAMPCFESNTWTQAHLPSGLVRGFGLPPTALFWWVGRRRASHGAAREGGRRAGAVGRVGGQGYLRAKVLEAHARPRPCHPAGLVVAAAEAGVRVSNPTLHIYDASPSPPDAFSKPCKSYI